MICSVSVLSTCINLVQPESGYHPTSEASEEASEEATYLARRSCHVMSSQIKSNQIRSDQAKQGKAFRRGARGGRQKRDLPCNSTTSLDLLLDTYIQNTQHAYNTHTRQLECYAGYLRCLKLLKM